MMKELKNNELSSVNGGYDMEYWIKVIQKEYSANDSEALTVVYDNLSRRFDKDNDINVAQKAMLRNIMDMLIEDKKRQEAE